MAHTAFADTGPSSLETGRDFLGGGRLRLPCAEQRRSWDEDIALKSVWGSGSGWGRCRRFARIAGPALLAPACFLFVEIDRSVPIQDFEDALVFRFLSPHRYDEAASTKSFGIRIPVLGGQEQILQFFPKRTGCRSFPWRREAPVPATLICSRGIPAATRSLTAASAAARVSK